MSNPSELLHRLVAEMAEMIHRNEDLDPQHYSMFFQHPEFALDLIRILDELEESPTPEHYDSPLYSACVFALDICVAQMQAAKETNNKNMAKSLTVLMNYLAQVIQSKKHGLGFWLPVLNAFYEVHVELTEELKDAYFDLANAEDIPMKEGEEFSHLDSIRDLIQELSELSIFDIAENFFAQSYAMPPEFFADLIVDLYSIEEAQDIALLLLLHPKAEVREVVIRAMDQLIHDVTLTSASLSRLQTIKYWFAEPYHSHFDQWIKIQRKKGVVFETEPKLEKMSIRATEIDGSGSQGVFIHSNKNRKNRLCGLLFKYESGLKDAWITPIIPANEVAVYYRQAFEESVTLREVEPDYFKLMAEHFLAITVERGEVPYLHFLEIQELLGMRLRPHKIDFNDLFNELSVQITPFTPETIEQSLQRSKSWLKNKKFTESWYLESHTIDRIVNQNSSFIEGVKVCRLIDAMDRVFVEELELDRGRWQFHFLWVALWVKSKAKKSEKIWQDSFLIAYVIRQGLPLRDIPVMREICHQTVINSVETMQERRTHLS